MGDEVYFTAVNGLTTRYAAAEMEILQPCGLEGMTESEFDLTMFTCTYGGKTRCTVRCLRV